MFGSRADDASALRTTSPALFLRPVSGAFETQSRAGSFLIGVTEGFSVQNPPASFDPTIQSITLQFSGLTDGISDLNFIGVAFSNNPLVQVTPTLSGDAAAETVTLSFSPDAFSVAGTISFTTVTSTDSVPALQNMIKLVSETVVASANSQTYGPLSFTVLGAVPEPASMSLMGSGLVCLLAFHRWSKRRGSAKVG